MPGGVECVTDIKGDGYGVGMRMKSGYDVICQLKER